MSWCAVNGVCVRRVEFTALPDAKAVEANFGSLAAKSPNDWNLLCFELLAHVASGDVPPKKAAPLIAAALEKRKDKAEAAECVADCLWAHDVQLGAAKLATERARLVETVVLLEASGAVGAPVLKRLLDEDCLEAAGLVQGAAFLKRMKKINTDRVYRQRKYNLLHEESEGYAKVVTLLAQLGGHATVGAAQTLRRLIGGFDLDPNRVFDLVLDALEARLDEAAAAAAHVALVGEFAASSLPHVLGFKFQHAHGAGDGTPRSLCRVAAALLVCGALAVDDLLPHLRPSREDLGRDQADVAQRASDKARALTVVSLGGDDDAAGAAAKKDDADDAADADDEARGDQIGGVVEALLLDARWALAEPLLQALERAGAVPAAAPATRDALAALAHALLEPLYAPMSPRGLGVHVPCAGGAGRDRTCTVRLAPAGGDGAGARLAAPETWPALVSALEPVLCHLSCYASSDAVLVTKLCRVAKAVLVGGCGGAVAREFVVRILKTCVLPSLSLMGPAPGVVFELWAAIGHLPFAERHDLYAAWRGRGVERAGIGFKHYDVSGAECRVGRDARAALKRVANEKKNSKQVGRLLAKLAHSNPLVVFDVILTMIESYDNMIAPLVESMGQMTPLALDVLAYLIPVHLADMRRAKLQPDGINVAHWFQYLAQFAGVFYRAHPATDLAPVLGYAVERLRQGAGVELLIFSELLARVGGCDVLEDISDTQLDGIAGGDALRRELLAFDRPSKRAAARLQDALCTETFAAPALALVAQQRAHALYGAGALNHVKLLGQLADKSQLVLGQLVDFVSKHAAYGSLLPPLDALVCDLRMDVATAMHAGRPLMLAAAAARRAAASAPKAAAMDVDGAAPAAGPAHLVAWDAEGPALRASLRLALPSMEWTIITPELYLLFWSLSLQDLQVPTKSYELQQAALKARSHAPFNADDKGKKEAKRCGEVCDTLATEVRQRTAHHAVVCLELERANAGLMGGVADRDRRYISESVLQTCVLPRLTLSPEDALYCAAFFHKLHDMKTPNFSSLQYFDRVIKDVFPTIYCATDAEARALGIFLKATLVPLKAWRASKELFERDASSKPGFSTSIGSTTRCAYEQYVAVFFRWYDRISKVALHCLDNYKKHGRTCLILLIKLVGVYPVRRRVYEQLMQRVDVLKAQDGMKDVQAMAQRYGQLLEQRKASYIDVVPVVKRKPATLDAKAATYAPAKANATKEAAEDEKAKDDKAKEPSKEPSKESFNESSKEEPSSSKDRKAAEPAKAPSSRTPTDKAKEKDDKPSSKDEKPSSKGSPKEAAKESSKESSKDDKPSSKESSKEDRPSSKAPSSKEDRPSKEDRKEDRPSKSSSSKDKESSKDDKKDDKKDRKESKDRDSKRDKESSKDRREDRKEEKKASSKRKESVDSDKGKDSKGSFKDGKGSKEERKPSKARDGDDKKKDDKKDDDEPRRDKHHRDAPEKDARESHRDDRRRSPEAAAPRSRADAGGAGKRSREERDEPPPTKRPSRSRDDDRAAPPNKGGRGATPPPPPPPLPPPPPPPPAAAGRADGRKRDRDDRPAPRGRR
ncbi:transcription factor/nuclear export subunit protein 2-domain-containing protein [Pelagophyceae sp. CCMP2097]|nr:transcription factor/nuclear export subunit protein 2-domain-containing protein [Pelagophyceae sp. CCMP2097]